MHSTSTAVVAERKSRCRRAGLQGIKAVVAVVLVTLVVVLCNDCSGKNVNDICGGGGGSAW